MVGGECMSKTNNNILLTGGQSQYYPTKKRGMSQLVMLSGTKRVMPVWTNWNASQYLFTLHNNNTMRFL